MMKPPPTLQPPAHARRGPLLAIVVLGTVLLVGGGIIATMLLRSPGKPSAAAGSGGQRDAVAAIEAGLASAAEYQRTGKFAEAAAILTKLSEQAPTDRAVRLALAQALLGQKRFEDALKQFDSAIALSSSTASSAASTAPRKNDPVLAQLHFEAGTCANAAGLADKAREYYQTAQALDPSEPRYPVYLAMVQIRTGDDAAAMASLVRAIKLNPDLAEAWGTMAELELKANRLSLASQHLDKARTLQPDVSRWRIVQARILNRQGEPEQAATILQSLPVGERGGKDIMALLAESFGMMKKPADAARMYEQAFAATPADPELAYLAATWYQRASDDAKARGLAQTASMLGHAGAKELLAGLETGR